MRQVGGSCVLSGGVAFMLAGALASCGSTAEAPRALAPRSTLTFHVVTKTMQKLDSVVSTGRQFLYVQNTSNTVWAAPPAGRPLHKFATMPRLVEETRGKTLAPSPGLYVNDDKTGYTYMAPAASLAGYAGDVIVGTESPRGLFWILKPSGNGFAVLPLRDNLPAGSSLEQAIIVR